MNQQFYIAVDGQQTGPFSYDELKLKVIQRDTLIWTEGLDNWTKAEHISLLKDILRATPPPLPNSETKTTTQQVPPPVVPFIPTGKYFGYELAKRRERLFAALIQGLIVFLPVILIFDTPFDSTDDYWTKRFEMALLFAIVGGLINLFFYPIWSGNIGHKIMGIKVISKTDGSDFNKSIKGGLREAVKHLLGFFFIPSIWLLWDEDRQNVYDKIFDTYVVKKK